jgi:hypothetical protein
MKRKLFSLFLLLVVAFQLLPVKEIGGMLFHNMLTEELCDALENQENNEESKESKKAFEDVLFNKTQYQPSLFIALTVHVDQDYLIQSRMADDTPTRPPLNG